MNEKTETILCCCMLVIIAVLACGIITMTDWNNNNGIKYNGNPEGWNWNINQTNGTIPVKHTSLTIYQEVIEPVNFISVNGKNIRVLNLDTYIIETEIGGMNVSVYDVLSGVYGPVVIETSEYRYDVVVQDDDIILKVIE